MLLRYKLIIGFLLVSLYGSCQFDPMSSLSMFNQMFYNPGYAGDGNEIEAKGLYRDQNLGIVGQPKSLTASIDMPFNLFNRKHGVGFNFVDDQIGFYNNKMINLSYAYRKPLIQGEIGFGIGINMVNLNDLSNATWIYGDFSAENDPLIPSGVGKEPWSFGLSMGVFYRADNLYFSMSSRNLGGTKVEYLSENGDSTYTNRVGNTYFISTGYDYQLANPLFAFQPNVFLSTDFSVTQVNLVGKLTYNNRIFGGLGYRPWDAAWLMAGLVLPSGIEIAVSYDIPTSRMIKASSGSFEFMVGYSFNLDIDKDQRKYKSVRLL